MEYQKIENLIDGISNQPCKFRTKNWVEINDESRGAYNVNSQIKFKTTMLKSSLCDYSDAYIFVKVGLSPSKKICVICLIESPLKMVKNNFYFILIALFVLKIFKFLSRLFGHLGKTA